jgi:hypothetical protein
MTHYVLDLLYRHHSSQDTDSIQHIDSMVRAASRLLSITTHVALLAPRFNTSLVFKVPPAASFLFRRS